MNDTGLAFVFSSDLYLTKFEEQYKAHRQEFNIKLKARYKIDTIFNSYADIVLYNAIEKRGFLIFNERGCEICRENLILIGEQVTAKS